MLNASLFFEAYYSDDDNELSDLVEIINDTCTDFVARESGSQPIFGGSNAFSNGIHNYLDWFYDGDDSAMEMPL